jgi:hypothetical protein
MVVSSLVRRGVELASGHLQKHPKQPSKQLPEIQLSGWLVALFFATLIAFVVISWSVSDYSRQYTTASKGLLLNEVWSRSSTPMAW